jgi:hypothetical protein
MATTETLEASSELSVLPRACYAILHIGLGPSQLQEPDGSPLKEVFYNQSKCNALQRRASEEIPLLTEGL